MPFTLRRHVDGGSLARRLAKRRLDLQRGNLSEGPFSSCHASAEGATNSNMVTLVSSNDLEMETHEQVANATNSQRFHT